MWLCHVVPVTDETVADYDHDVINVCCRIFDLVNIHLIHDVSNIAAMETVISSFVQLH